MTEKADIIRILQRLEDERRRHAEAMDGIEAELVALMPAESVKQGLHIFDWRAETEKWKTNTGATA